MFERGENCQPEGRINEVAPKKKWEEWDGIPDGQELIEDQVKKRKDTEEDEDQETETYHPGKWIT